MRKRHEIPIPTWQCLYCGYVHYAADLVRIDNERLECCQCDQAFTPVKAGRQSVDWVQGLVFAGQG
jgi:hypothetical protein